MLEVLCQSDIDNEVKQNNNAIIELLRFCPLASTTLKRMVDLRSFSHLTLSVGPVLHGQIVLFSC